MRGFEHHNPIAVAICFAAIIAIAMLCLHPVLLLVALSGGVWYFFLHGRRHRGTHGMAVLVFLCTALINPLVSHNGATVLLVLNDAPITAEALCYGVVAATMIVSVLYWFMCFSTVMTEDKLLYLFGGLSPRLALVLSMGLRYVPLLLRQMKRIRQTQQGIGLYRAENIVARAQGELRVFSVLVTYALENGIITADSMAARGYGTGGRTRFSLFRWRVSDLLLVLLTMALAGVTLAAVLSGALDFSFYPTIRCGKTTVLTYLGCGAYATLCWLPAISELGEGIRWKYLRSKM